MFKQDKSVQILQIHILSKYAANFFWVTVHGVVEKREGETENGSGKEHREHRNVLPTNLDPGIDKEADCENNECNSTYAQHKH